MRTNSRVNDNPIVCAVHGSVRHRQQREDDGSGSSAQRAQLRTKMLAAGAGLGSVWALVARPLSRRLGMIMDPASCPDACWQTVLLSALTLGPLLGSLAFVAVIIAKGCFSATAWRRMTLVPLLVVVGTVMHSLWSTAGAQLEAAAPAAERAFRSLPCCLSLLPSWRALQACGGPAIQRTNDSTLGPPLNDCFSVRLQRAALGCLRRACGRMFGSVQRGGGRRRRSCRCHHDQPVQSCT